MGKYLRAALANPWIEQVVALRLVMIACRNLLARREESDHVCSCESIGQSVSAAHKPQKSRGPTESYGIKYGFL